MTPNARARVGIIGGSGFYNMPGLGDRREIEVDTPFGSPSDQLVVGNLDDVEVAFLPRHGRGHRIPPSALNVRANIWALKSLGVEWVLAVSAVGSMREEIRPLDVVIPDQLIDRTRQRPSTFFDEPGLVAHVGMANPLCPELRGVAADAVRGASGTVHRGGTYICIEGPQFSTRAESELYRSWGVHVIGMTALPEARLAREAELCYAVMAMATDYDVWHASEEPVTAEMVVRNLAANAELARRAVQTAVPAAVEQHRTCDCASALASAIVTEPDAMSESVRERLSLLVGPRLDAQADS